MEALIDAALVTGGSVARHGTRGSINRSTSSKMGKKSRKIAAVTREKEALEAGGARIRYGADAEASAASGSIGLVIAFDSVSLFSRQTDQSIECRDFMSNDHSLSSGAGSFIWRVSTPTFKQTISSITRLM